jgi:hypothetical protein
VFLPRVILAWLVIAWGTAAPSARAVDIEALLAGMTLDEKIGQMTQAERGSATPDDVRDYFLGSILSGGGSAPASNTPTGWADMHDAYQNAALGTRLGIPIIYGIDAVHGHNNVVGATIFPHNIGLGATRDPALIEEIGRLTAKEVRCTGLEWTFAPCVAVVRDERWGRTYEGFGEDPAAAVAAGGRLRPGPPGHHDERRAGDRLRQALRGRRRHRGRHRPRDTVVRRAHAAGCSHARFRGSDRRGGRHDHAVVQQLERREAARERVSAHRCAQDGDSASTGS